MSNTPPFETWTERLTRFLMALSGRFPGNAEVRSDFASAILEQEIIGGQNGLRIGMPASVAEFLQKGSSKCDFSYRLTIPEGKRDEFDLLEDEVSGGACLFGISDFAEYQNDCQQWATETWIADYPEDKEQWLNSFPFVAIGNGDYLGLDVRQQQADPPVIYLSHDDASEVISPSLKEFLLTWERLCYISPEIWVLRDYFDPASGMLSADSERGKQLRRLLLAEP